MCVRSRPGTSAGRCSTPSGDDVDVVVAEVSSFQLDVHDGGVPAARRRRSSTSPRTISTGTAPSTRTPRRRPGSSSTRTPTTCSCSTPTTPWSRGSPPARPGGGCRSPWRPGPRPASASWTTAAGPPPRRRRRHGARRRRRRSRDRAPHDLANALAAAAARARGRADCRRRCAGRLRAFDGLPHRLQPRRGARRRPLLRRLEGHERARDRRRGPRASRRSCSSPGGSNKGLDLSALAQDVRRSLRAVVAIGDAAPEIVAALRGSRPGRRRDVDARRGSPRRRVALCRATWCSCRPDARPSTGTRLRRARRRLRREVSALDGGEPVTATAFPHGRRLAAGRTARRPKWSPARSTRPRRSPRSGPARTCTLLGTIAVLNVIGVVMVLSASSVVSLTSYGSAWYFFERQLVWTLLGVAAFLVAARIDYRQWRTCVRPLLIGSVVLLVLVLVPDVGVYVSGSRRWLGIGTGGSSRARSPSSRCCSSPPTSSTRREDELADWRRVLRPSLLVLVCVGGLVLLEPDLDSTVLLGLIVGVGARRRRDPDAAPLRRSAGAVSRSRRCSRSRRRTGAPGSSPSCTRRRTPATPATRSCSR